MSELSMTLLNVDYQSVLHSLRSENLNRAKHWLQQAGSFLKVNLELLKS